MPREGASKKRRRRRRLGKPGGRPGDLVPDPGALQTQVSVIAYGADRLDEHGDLDLDSLAALLGQVPVVWVQVIGLEDQDRLSALAKRFSIHPLALEDVVNVPQRPKIEAYGEHHFLVLHGLDAESRLERRQISLYLREGFLISFQEAASDPFAGVRSRLLSARGRIRRAGADYLAYALLDAAIDHYFPVLEAFQESLEDLEDELRRPSGDALDRIQLAREDLAEARRAIAPVRDLTRSLLSAEWDLFTEETRVFLRDCHDHAQEASDQLDTCREISSGLMDIHLSTVSHQSNQTMKVLTVIATIFMPLSFLAGVYGMNFDPGVSRWNMPELSHPFGYPILLGAMGLLGLGLLWAFWKRGWFE